MTLALALFAGFVTTAAGMGGGQLLVLGLSWLYGPVVALAWTAPALWMGNAHRLALFRGDLHLRQWGRFAAGAIPGALIGAAALPLLPPRLLVIAMAVLALAGVARALLPLRPLPLSSLPPGGLLTGVVASTAGGAGIVAGPLWQGVGVRGDAYVAMMAASAVALHSARMLGYAVIDGLPAGTWSMGVPMGVAIWAGNLLGRAFRARLGDPARHRTERAALALCCGSAIGVALTG